jgi:hypothetical protein
VVTRCNSVVRLTDDFEDGVDANFRWAASYSNPGASFAETGGDLVLTPATNAGSNYTGYVSTLFYDLRGQRMWTEVSQLPNAGVELGIGANYDDGGTSWIHLALDSGQIRATQTVMGVYSNLIETSYDVSQRFLGIREDQGHLLFETSADGVTFTTFFDAPVPFDVSLLRPYLFAGTYNPVANPGVVHFASFHGDAVTAPASQACGVSTLMDTFDDGVTDHRWERSYNDPCCTASESGGALALTSNGSNGYAARRSAAGYSLVEDAVTWALPTGPQPSSNVYADLGIEAAGNNLIALQIKDTQLNCWIRKNALPSDDLNGTRNPGENFFRIRHTGGQIFFEASTDRITWRLLRQAAEPFPVDEVSVKLELGSPTNTNPSSASFDDLGIP